MLGEHLNLAFSEHSDKREPPNQLLLCSRPRMEVLTLVLVYLRNIQLSWGLKLRLTPLISYLYHQAFLKQQQKKLLIISLSCCKNYLNAYNSSESAFLSQSTSNNTLGNSPGTLSNEITSLQGKIKTKTHEHIVLQLNP